MTNRTPESARRYHHIRYGLLAARMAVFAGVLLYLQATPFASLIAAAAGELTPSFWLQILFVALAVHGLLYAAALPLRFYGGFRLEKEYGLSNENLGRWLADELKSLALSLVFSALLIEAFYAAVTLWPGGWWAVFGAVWAVAVVVLSAIFPSVVVPMFYPMTPLKPGPVRDRILALAARLGVRVKGVYEIALSRKTRKANAAVLGIGGLRRIVMGDTLLASFSPEEIDVVLSHELGHYVRGHNRLSLAVHIAGGVAGIFAAFWIAPRFAAALGGDGIADLRIYPGLVLALACAEALAVPGLNAFSRHLEREADAFALQTTRSRAAFVSVMRKLGDQNLADTDPHPVIEWLLFSHPSILRRIRYAEKAQLN